MDGRYENNLDTVYEDLINRDDYWKGNPGKKMPIRESVLHWLRIVNARKVLDAGCGRGDLGWFLKKCHLEVHGCDIADASDYCSFPFKKAGITDLPYGDDSFDAIVCVDVIEHLPTQDINKAILEMFRVAKHIIIHAACYSSRHEPYGELHLIIQNPDWWIKKFCKHGRIIKKHVEVRTKKINDSIRKTLRVLIERENEDSV